MDLIRSFCEKLRVLAVTLDVETARLQRALDGEDSDFEGYPLRILHGLHSEVRTLKDDVSTLLDKASSESKESIVFIKATKVLMKKNSEDIVKIREFFQKYGYNPRARKNSEELKQPAKNAGIAVNRASSYIYPAPASPHPMGAVGEQEVVDSTLESTGDESLQQPGVQGGVSGAAVPLASERPPCSPQLSDFGLERYLIPQVPPNPPPVETDRKEELDVFPPSSQQSLIKGLKTPKCALNMDDFACVTPKLEHVGIPEYTMCFNDDYTVGLKKVQKKSKEAGEAEPVSRGHPCATPGLTQLQLEKDDAEYTESPLAPTFCTPGLKIPSAKNSTALVSTDCSASNTNSSSNNLDVKDCTSFILNADKCFENFMAPSSPVISSYENLLKTPTPPKVTAIPEDILQILSKYNPNLATPVAIEAAPPGGAFLPEEGRRVRAAAAPSRRVDSGGPPAPCGN